MGIEKKIEDVAKDAAQGVKQFFEGGENAVLAKNEAARKAQHEAERKAHDEKRDQERHEERAKREAEAKAHGADIENNKAYMADDMSVVPAPVEGDASAIQAEGGAGAAGAGAFGNDIGNAL
ncbi:hypothetical protein E3E12_02145 [Formicincola oecophyllae]|uniref:Uncharacterized protein n=1 Tax=Formicincola oecophyllae TaxID=2558361 RepID=A0A4Y6UAN9_9PROT|nr:hypothetical protein [Formicincola oecophyllae]QDH13195.2 hypothetical protein E3E12_02145 [Formicincola oecophyllae]